MVALGSDAPFLRRLPLRALESLLHRVGKPCCELRPTRLMQRSMPSAYSLMRLTSVTADKSNRWSTKFMERWQTIDLLINNSGLAVPETVEAITEDGWNKVIDTNLRGVVQLVRTVLPHMRKNDFGDIVNVSSQAGKHGYADVPSYCASKFGLLGYAAALRDHVRKTGANIRVFNFCPGLVDVENTRREQQPREGFIHVANMARTLMYVLSLDRNVVLEDLNIYGR